jgi:hypothetical protein
MVGIEHRNNGKATNKDLTLPDLIQKYIPEFMLIMAHKTMETKADIIEINNLVFGVSVFLRIK